MVGMRLGQFERVGGGYVNAHKAIRQLDYPVVFGGARTASAGPEPFDINPAAMPHQGAYQSPRHHREKWKYRFHVSACDFTATKTKTFTDSRRHDSRFPCDPTMVRRTSPLGSASFE